MDTQAVREDQPGSAGRKLSGPIGCVSKGLSLMLLFGSVFVLAGSLFIAYIAEEAFLGEVAQLRKVSGLMAKAGKTTLSLGGEEWVLKSGSLKPDKPIEDPFLPRRVQALRMERETERYEFGKSSSSSSHKSSSSSSHKSVGRGRTTRRGDSPLSNLFGQKNPKEWKALSKKLDPKNPLYPMIDVEKASAARFADGQRVAPELVALVPDAELMPFQEADLPELRRMLPQELRDKAKIYLGELYIGDNPERPSVQDLRMSVKVVAPGEFTFLTPVREGRLVPHGLKRAGEQDGQVKGGEDGLWKNRSMAYVVPGIHDLNGLVKEYSQYADGEYWEARWLVLQVGVPGLLMLLGGLFLSRPGLARLKRLVAVGPLAALAVLTTMVTVIRYSHGMGGVLDAGMVLLFSGGAVYCWRRFGRTPEDRHPAAA